MPYPREVAQDKVLNNIASYYGHEGCVYKEVAPIVDVNHISGKYYVFGREELRVMNDTLGRRSHANELDWHVTTAQYRTCLLYTSPSPRDRTRSRMPSSA